MKKDDTPITPPPRKKMPAEVFVRIWSNNLNPDKEKEWLGWVIFDTFQGIRRANLSNIEVEGDIRIEITQGTPYPPTHLHLKLSNCLLANLELINTLIRSISVQNHTKIGNFRILNSMVEDVFIENSKIGNFSILNSTTGRFSVQDNSTTGDFWIQDNSTTKHFLIRGNSRTGDIRIQSNSTTGSFEIVNHSVTGNFLIQGASTIGDIDARDNSNIGNINIRQNSTIKKIFFQGNSIAGDLKIDHSKAATLSLSENSHLAEMNLSHSILQRVEVRSGSFVGYLKCQFNLQEPIRLLFEDSSLVYLDFTDLIFPEFTTLSVSNCLINYLRLHNFCNYGTVFFSSLKQIEKWEDVKRYLHGQIIFKEGKYQFETISHSSILHLADSDLGKTQFINCDLRQFQRFEFSNTKMLDVFVAGSQMPSDKAFCLPNGEEDPLKIAEQKRLAYGQFKKIYEARGDVAGSLPYLAYEMEAYRQQLQLEGWWKHRGELFMLWMNKLSTNYGVSWQRGLIVTVAAMIFFYSVFCLMLGYVPGTDVSKFIKIASFAPQYLNPFRDADSVIPNNYLPPHDVFGNPYDLDQNKNPILPPFARLWDYLSRIFVAYFVYQTIQAFRKLGKSSG